MEIVTFRDAFKLPVGTSLTDRVGARWTVEPWAIAQYGRNLRFNMSESDEALPYGPFTREGTATTDFRSRAMVAPDAESRVPLPGETWARERAIRVDEFTVDALYLDSRGMPCVTFSDVGHPGHRYALTVESFQKMYRPPA